MIEKVFAYGKHEIHAYEINGEVWFKASDIGEALGKTRGQKYIREKLNITQINEYPVPDKKGSMQPTYLLNEKNVWKIIDEASNEEFARWFDDTTTPYIEAVKSRIISADDLVKKLRLKVSCFYSVFLKTHNIYVSTAEVARDFNKSERWLMLVLIEIGILKKSKGTGEISVKKAYPAGKYWVEWDDESTGATYFKWTSKGVLLIMNKLEELGYKTIYDV